MSFSIDKKKITKNTLTLYVRMGITMIISFFMVRVTLKQLGEEDYGLNNVVSSIVSMLSFLNGSMGTAVQRFFSIEIGREDEKALSRVFGVGLSLHGLVALITFATAEVFALCFLEKMNIPPERMWAAHVVFQMSIISLVLNILNVPYAALLRAREQFSKTAVVEIVQAFLRLGVLYLLVTINYDKLVTLAFLNFGITLYYVGALTFMARQYREAHSMPEWNKDLVKRMLKFISLLVVTILCQLLKVQGLVFLINLFFGLAINAAFAIAVQVSNMVNTFIMSFKQSMVPQIVASYGASDMNSMFRLINIGTKITFALLLLISLPIIFEADFLLNLWLGDSPQYSSTFVILTVIYINIASFTYFLYQGVHATGNITQQQIWMSSLYVVNIVLVYIVFKLGWGFFSALYINMIISAIQCFINVYYAHKCFRYDIASFVRKILLPCMLTTGILLFVLNFIVNIFNPSFIRVIFTFTASTIVTALCTFWILLSFEERQICTQNVSLIINKYIKRF